jgi:hypothetical protein
MCCLPGKLSQLRFNVRSNVTVHSQQGDCPLLGEGRTKLLSDCRPIWHIDAIVEDRVAQ